MGNLFQRHRFTAPKVAENVQKQTGNVTGNGGKVAENVTENYRLDKGGSLYFNL